jgi:hypothetical protein
MTAMELATMNDDGPAVGGQIARVALMILAAGGALFGIGVTAGLIAAHVDHGGGVTLEMTGLVAGALLFAAACGYALWRLYRTAHAAAGAPTTRERRNRTVLIACGAMGGVIGLVLAMAGPSPFATFSNEPISPTLALLLAVPIAVVLPIVSIYWHRHVVDEQEAAAYNLGALIGVSAYFIGAPVWWLLWRGGLLPAPDGILIYFTTIAVTGLVWIWAKYR